MKQSPTRGGGWERPFKNVLFQDEIIVELLKHIKSVVDPDDDLSQKVLIKLIRKNLKKFEKTFGKMNLMEKVEMIMDHLALSDEPLDQAYDFFLKNLHEVWNGNEKFENVIYDVKTGFLELALETVQNLETEIKKLFLKI